ncbi:DUF6162 family protein [Photobacterium minamisatsumaniensis]|uniref:DUF6162 family protein n=1 Tax=Photobacterium minamisatsumaniensis TaxID=2910233 RepID=UPI003D0B020D
MITQSVHSDDGGREGKWVALSIAIILIIAAFTLPMHQASSKGQILAPYQVSISDLATPELAMVADLRLAHEEIRNIYQDNRDFEPAMSSDELWPELAELEEIWLAPFVKDKSWEYKGKHQWLHIAPAYYQGVKQVAQGSASVILHTGNNDPEIWFALFDSAQPLTRNLEQPHVLLSPEKLIEAGWIKVVFASASDSHVH